MRQTSQVKSPNITQFEKACEEAGINLNDPNINERALFKAYSEGKPPEKDKIIDNPSDPEMEIQAIPG